MASTKSIYAEGMEALLTALPLLKRMTSVLEDRLTTVNEALADGGSSSFPPLSSGYKSKQDGVHVELIAERDMIQERLDVILPMVSLIESAVASLDEDELEMYCLRFEKRCSYREIGERIHYSKDAVRRHMNSILEGMVFGRSNGS